MFLPTPKAILPLAFLAVAHVPGTNAASKCEELSLTVPLSANNTVFNFTLPKTNTEVTDFILDLARPGANIAEQYRTGYAETAGTYIVAASLCLPENAPDAGPALQILSHGLGFTRSYWDYKEYSYVDAALARGYATLSYDRLGTGASRVSTLTGADPEPVNELQSAMEVALLRALTDMARTGKLGDVGKFDRVLHVGHSLGAITICGAVAADKALSNGVALTGFTPSGAYVPLFQLGSNFVSAAGGEPAALAYPDGYIKFGSSSALHANQFASGGGFDPALLEPLYQELQPVGIGTLLTLGDPLAEVNAYPGSVFVVVGARDLPFCGGNCERIDPDLPSQIASFFRGASSFQGLILSGVGHALNLHRARDEGYSAILDFFDGLTT